MKSGLNGLIKYDLIKQRLAKSRSKDMILYLVFFVTLISFFCGCMSSPAKRYYQLHTGLVKNAPVIDKVIMVGPVEVERAYNDSRVVYRLSPYELNYYSYRYWVKKPGMVVRDAICRFFKQNDSFKGVIRKFAEGTPDFLLHVKLNAIEEYDYRAAWFAHLDLELEIKDFKSRKVLLTQHIANRKRLVVKDISRLPVILSTILEEELTKFLKDLSTKLSASK